MGKDIYDGSNTNNKSEEHNEEKDPTNGSNKEHTKEEKVTGTAAPPITTSAPRHGWPATPPVRYQGGRAATPAGRALERGPLPDPTALPTIRYWWTGEWERRGDPEADER